MSDSQQRAKRRKKLWSLNPKCPTCGVETILVENLPAHVSQPDNQAVLRQNAPGEPTVLSCMRCATKLNKAENDKLGIEELRLRSSKQGMCNCPTCGNRHFKSIIPPKASKIRDEGIL